MSFKLTPKQANYIRPVLGIIVLIIGLVSMVLPFLPLGYLFTLGGVILLAPDIPFLKRFISFLEKKDKKGRVEKATEKFTEVEEKVKRKVSTKGD
jgi:membrane protein implicated in regulation of membrane protease activity